MTVLIKKRLGVEALTTVIMNCYSHRIEEYDDVVGYMYQIGSYTSALMNHNLD